MFDYQTSKHAHLMRLAEHLWLSTIWKTAAAVGKETTDPA